MTSLTNSDELLMRIDDAIGNMSGITHNLTPDQFNTAPFEGSWTPGQVVEHVTKSMRGMIRALQAPGEPPGRDPEARVEGLREVFLNFSQKLNAPEFIIPEARTYEKDASIEGLLDVVKKLKENAGNTDLSQLLSGLPLGPITKKEIIYFTLFHTMRHTYQLENMKKSLSSSAS